MERNVLVNEIASFCFQYGIFDKSIRVSEIKNRIRNQLDNVEFIENLINTLIIKTRNRKNIDVEKLKELLLELEKIRLELEYKDSLL